VSLALGLISFSLITEKNPGRRFLAQFWSYFKPHRSMMLLKSSIRTDMVMGLPSLPNLALLRDDLRRRLMLVNLVSMFLSPCHCPCSRGVVTREVSWATLVSTVKGQLGNLIQSNSLLTLCLNSGINFYTQNKVIELLSCALEQVY
jgi:hypothetical protein